MITVNVRLFAGLQQLLGQREMQVQLPDGATVAELRDQLGAEHPVVGVMLRTVVYAIDEEYVGLDQPLADGDRLALIPPVSGGSQLPRQMSTLQLVLVCVVASLGAIAIGGRFDLGFLLGFASMTTLVTLLIVRANDFGRRRELKERNAPPSQKSTPSVRARIALISAVTVGCLVVLGLIDQNRSQLLAVVGCTWTVLTSGLLIMWRFRRRTMEARGIRW